MMYERQGMSKTTTIPPALPSIPRTVTASRVRLRTETELKLADVDARSAACYADAEKLAAQLAATASKLSNEAAVPQEIDMLEDTSAVHHIEVLRERLSTDEQVALTRSGEVSKPVARPPSPQRP
jgi:hypothetical protein